jgi:hypothetical protein
MMTGIDGRHLREVCRMGQGKDCCAFIIVGRKGIQCAKGTEFEAEIRARVHKMVARGDNCNGYGSEEGE